MLLRRAGGDDMYLNISLYFAFDQIHSISIGAAAASGNGNDDIDVSITQGTGNSITSSGSIHKSQQIY